MSVAAERRTLPLVAVLYDVPLFAESLEGVFDGFAELRAFPADSNPEDLLRWLRPDAVVVEGREVREPVLAFANEAAVPLVHVRLAVDAGVSVIGAAPRATDSDVSPRSIRNAVAGVLAAGAGA